MSYQWVWAGDEPGAGKRKGKQPLLVAAVGLHRRRSPVAQIGV